MRQSSPVILADYPNPDVIRVGDTYYMISDSMHFFPGGEILRSFDLKHWERAAYVFERLDSTPAQRLSGEQSIYGKGMSGGRLGYENGKFRVCFTAQDTGKTYAYTAKDAQGPWIREKDRDVSGGSADAGADEAAANTAGGERYAWVSVDYGAAGRFPALVRDEGAVAGDGSARGAKLPASTRPKYRYTSLFSSELFADKAGRDGGVLIHPAWQWNHEPDDRLWKRTDDGGLLIKTGKISVNVVQAVNTLTQRVHYPASSMEVSLDTTDLGSGDYAGICLLQGCYGLIGVTKDIGRRFLVVQERDPEVSGQGKLTADYMPASETFRVPITENIVRLKVRADFHDPEHTAEFFFLEKGKWIKVGSHRLYPERDHGAGCRFGLFLYSTRKIGGETVFYDVSFSENGK